MIQKKPITSDDFSLNQQLYLYKTQERAVYSLGKTWTWYYPLPMTGRVWVWGQLWQYQFHRRSASSRLRSAASPPSSSPAAPAHRNTDLWPAASHNTDSACNHCIHMTPTRCTVCIPMHITLTPFRPDLFCIVVFEAQDVCSPSAG